MSNVDGAVQLKLTVGRNFENRKQDQSDDSPLAWKAHRRRAEILRNELEGDANWAVVDWGDTFDENRTHADVTIIIALLGVVGKEVALWMGKKVLLRAVEETVAEAIKKLIRKLVPAMRKEKISRNYLELADGTTVEWHTPGYENEVDVTVTRRVSLSLEDFLAAVESSSTSG